MKNYKQLSQAQRYQIEILNKAGKSQKEIAELLSVSGSTVCRELKRNRSKKGYTNPNKLLFESPQPNLYQRQQF